MHHDNEKRQSEYHHPEQGHSSEVVLNPTPKTPAYIVVIVGLLSHAASLPQNVS